MSAIGQKLRNGEVVVNEKCSCKHNITEHADTLQKGHGRCLKFGCSCARFTWEGFVTIRGVK